MRSSSLYYDIDAILAEEERVPTVLNYDAFNLGYFNQNHHLSALANGASEDEGESESESESESDADSDIDKSINNKHYKGKGRRNGKNDYTREDDERILRAGTALELPLWLAAYLAEKVKASIEPPRSYSVRFRTALIADPSAVGA